VSDSPLSISECTTFEASFADDLAAYAAAGADGIGIWEFKLPKGEDARSLDQVAASGLDVSICVPEVPSVYPDGYFGEPAEPAARVVAMKGALRRFAPFKPAAVLVVTGDPTGRDVAEMRRVTVEGLREVADEAAELGLTLGLEAYRVTSGSLVSTIPGMIDLADEVGRDNLRIVVDTWHVWDDTGVLDDLKRYADRFVGVQVCDWRNPSRSWADRVLPGDGVIDWSAMLGALDEAGFDGWYDIEIFSDNGQFGNKWPDSLWARDADDLAREAVSKFRALVNRGRR